MKRFLKWFFGILFFLIIIVVGAVIALPYIVNPNDYKDEIIAEIKPHMHGRDLQIPGDIKLYIFPWLGVEVGEVVIGNAEGFVLKPFMVIKNSKAHIRLLSLLSDQPEIGSLEFRDVTVNLQQDPEGRNNWSDLAQAETTSTGTTGGLVKVANSPASKPTESKPEFTLPSMKVEGLHFYNVRVEFNDQKANDVITLTKLNLDAGPINQFNPVPLKGKFNFHSKKNKLTAASAFATTMVMTSTLDDFSFKKFIMNTNLSGKAVNNNVIKTSVKIPDLNIKTKEEKITAKPLSLQIDNMKSEGRLTIKRFEKPIIRFALQMGTLNLDKFIPAKTETADEKKQDRAVGETAAGKTTVATDSDIPTVDDLIGDKPIPVDTTNTLFAPLAALKETDMQGVISIEELQMKDLVATKVKANLQARSGLISAIPSAVLYGGSYDGNIQVQIKAIPALLSTKHTLRNVQMGPLTKALTGKESLTGQANMQGQFFSTGGTLEAITENLNGDGQFSMRDARIKTLDVKQLILKENYEKLEFAKESDEDKQVTVFTTMRGTIRVKDGIAYNKDFNAISRRIHLKGAGYADLVKKNVKYTLTLIPKKSFGFNMGSSRFDLKNKRIKTHFTGPWSNIDVDNDLEEVLKAEFKQSDLYKKKRAKEEKMKDEIKQEKEKLEQKYKNKLDEILSQ